MQDLRTIIDAQIQFIFMVSIAEVFFGSINAPMKAVFASGLAVTGSDASSIICSGMEDLFFKERME